MKISSSIALCLALSITACASISANPTGATAKTKKDFNVELKPNPKSSPTKLKATNSPQGWKRSGKKYGYVGFDTGEDGNITFQLKWEGDNKKCISDDGTATATWVITRIELSATGDYGDEKGSRFGESQASDPWLRDAFPAVDLSNGAVFQTADISEGRTTVSIEDANAQVGERFIFYEVTATNCANDKVTIKIDPGVGNGGK